MYPYMTLNDDTEITHSEILSDGRVRVYVETPDEHDGFHQATCFIPGYLWVDVYGYSEMEMRFLKGWIVKNAALIREFAGNGGYACA